ncbi:hypothetical protein GCM10023191_092450 [Actinoallomurus oryzae]|uniref:Uncharacterized protein n=1 Tax=Actinoallomurus oryzae TaxID=502180 RepID=A0ABP8R5I8_9ACTN
MTAPEAPAPLRRKALDLIREAEAVMTDPGRTVDQVDAIYWRLATMLGRLAPYIGADDEG